MSEKKVLSVEDLKKLQDQQQRYSQILIEIGAADVVLSELTQQKLGVEDEKKSLYKDLATLREQAETLQKELSETYGDGNVNITTGEFTPIEK
jgi:predicted  nucleic acid-binding Zn-ribbon protein